MLARTLEAEVMDTPAEALDYDRMDHAAVNRAFASDFLQAFRARDQNAPAAPPLVLDAGTGTALIPIELCRQAPEITVVALDAAGTMLELARRHVLDERLSTRVLLARADAKRLPLADRSCDAVVSNSIVHHLPRPERLFAEAVRVVRPGGLLFVRDLLRPPSEAALQSLVENHAGAANSRQRRLFADSLRAALTLDEARAIVTGLGLAPDAVAQTSDRHWTWTAELACKGLSR